MSRVKKPSLETGIGAAFGGSSAGEKATATSPRWVMPLPLLPMLADQQELGSPTIGSGP